MSHLYTKKRSCGESEPFVNCYPSMAPDKGSMAPDKGSMAPVKGSWECLATGQEGEDDPVLHYELL
jgi:hypothetical protein